MLFGRGNRDQTCETCWKELPYGFKVLFISSLAYNALSIFFSFLMTQVIFQASMVVENFQIWRIFFSFMPAGPMPSAILNILINFLWLMSIYPPLEKKFSTSFILVQTFIQNLMINLVLSVLGVVVFYIFSMDPQQTPIFCFGMFPLCMIFIWYQAAQNPDQHTNFCCMPCMIQMKWIPVILLVMSLIFASPLLLALIAAFCLGYLQFMHLKRRLIKLPVRFYRKIDQLLPKSITDRPDYVKVQTVERQLIEQCSAAIAAGGNPFERNQNQNNEAQQPNKVQVIGKGVSIGGGSSNAQNFKGFWANKAVENLHQQVQIQPVAVRPEFKVKSKPEVISPNYLVRENDSKLGLNDSGDKQSQEELGQQQQKKVVKRNLLD